MDTPVPEGQPLSPLVKRVILPSGIRKPWDNVPIMTILTIMTKKAIPLAEAKAHLSELVVRAAYGNEEFLITRRGKPAALLTSARPKGERAHLADARGWLDNHDPFFECLEAARRESRRRGPRILH